MIKNLIVVAVLVGLTFGTVLAAPGVERVSQANTATTPFTSIQAAYNDTATIDTDLIQCSDSFYREDLVFNKPLDIKVAGGMSGATSVYSLTISGGKVTISNVKLQPKVCGNGIVESGEQCDDGNVLDGDGCSSVCAIEMDYICNSSPSICTSCQYSSWSDWSVCSLPCQGGTTTRTRTLLTSGPSCNQPLQETQPCNQGVRCVCSDIFEPLICLSTDVCEWTGGWCQSIYGISECSELVETNCETSGLSCQWLPQSDICMPKY